MLVVDGMIAYAAPDAKSITPRQEIDRMLTPHRPHLALAVIAGACLAALAAPSYANALEGTLYPGLGYDIVEIAPGQLAPVGYVSPTMSYTLPNSSTGGTASGDITTQL